jgi:hypothetical protein
VGVGVAGAGRALEDRELAALRSVLVGPERGQIRKILQRLDDPATRAAEIARILPEAIALRGAEDDGFAETMVPLVRRALGGALRENPHLLVTAMRGALLELMWAPWRFVGRAFHRRRGTAARLEQLYLIDRETGDVIDQSMRPLDLTDAHAEEDARRIASMVTYLLAFLRDPEHLGRYSDLGQVRIDRITYGICAGSGVVLLSVVHGQLGVEGELERCRDMLIKMDEDWYHGRRTKGAHSWLPKLDGEVGAQKEPPAAESDGRPDSHVDSDAAADD